MATPLFLNCSVWLTLPVIQCSMHTISYTAYLLGLLALIILFNCSYQLDNWYACNCMLSQSNNFLWWGCMFVSLLTAATESLLFCTPARVTHPQIAKSLSPVFRKNIMNMGMNMNISKLSVWEENKKEN